MARGDLLHTIANRTMEKKWRPDPRGKSKRGNGQQVDMKKIPDALLAAKELLLAVGISLKTRIG